MSKEKTQKKRLKKISYHLKSLLLLSLSALCIYSVTHEVITYVDIRKKMSEEQAIANQIKTETEALIKQKEMLQDPNYAINYARGKLLISQNGEQIFSLDDSK